MECPTTTSLSLRQRKKKGVFQPPPPPVNIFDLVKHGEKGRKFNDEKHSI